MQYKVWENGIIRDATPEEIEQIENLPKPYEETDFSIKTEEAEELDHEGN